MSGAGDVAEPTTAEPTTAEPTTAAPITIFGPDFPFAYDEWIAHPAGLGEVPADALGAEVASSEPVWPGWSRRTS